MKWVSSIYSSHIIYTRMRCSFTVCMQVFCEFTLFESSQQITSPPYLFHLAEFSNPLIKTLSYSGQKNTSYYTKHTRSSCSFNLKKKHILFQFLIHIQGVIQKFLAGGSSTKKCDHDCDQALTKSSWGSVQSIHILVS